MSREVDRRDQVESRIVASRTNDLSKLAADVSDRLPGSHRVFIRSFDRATGNPSGIVSVASAAERGNYIQRSLDHLQNIRLVLGLTPNQPAEFVADPHYQELSSNAVAVHIRQNYKGIPIFGASETVRFTPQGALAETAGTSVTVVQEVSTVPRLAVQQAVLKAAQHVAVPDKDELDARDQFGQFLRPLSMDLTGFTPKLITAFGDKVDQPTVLEAGPFGDAIKASLIWFSLGPDLRLCWQVVLVMPLYEGRYRVLVDAETGDILYAKQLVQAVAAKGNVYRIDPSGPRQLTDFPQPLTDYRLPLPLNLPNGFPEDWVSADRTVGNSVDSHLEDAGPTLTGTNQNGLITFDPADPLGDDQQILNVFYYCCDLHDFFYLLGFREADGNFQRDNYGRGGGANDPVDARVYAGPVWATASMATPDDSLSPVMKLGLVETSNRPTALDATIVFHEFTHGVTHRLVGGAKDDQSLEAPQSQSMGEGWSDYIACTLTGKITIGSWAIHNAAGVRGYPYDSNFPDDFGKIGTGRYTEIHNIGEIWCATLMELNRKIGTNLTLQLVIDALKLSPTNPSFLDMRDSIIAALASMRIAGRMSDSNYATNLAGIWSVFARFGMGPQAKSNRAYLSGIVADFQSPNQQSGTAQSGWKNWYRIGAATDGVPPQTTVAAVVPVAGVMDLFVVGYDGGIYTNSWSAGVGKWGDWNRVGNVGEAVSPLTTVTAVARTPDDLHLFVVGDDGGIYTTSQNRATAKWQQWNRVGPAAAPVPTQSTVSAVARTPGRLDIFVVGYDGGIYTTSWEAAASEWQPWSRVGGARDTVPPQSPLTAVVRGSDRLDLFVTGFDGGVYTTSCNGAASQWQDWLPVGRIGVQPRSVVSAVARTPGRLDIFAVGVNGGIYSASRDEAANAWQNWSLIGAATDVVPPGSVVTAVARKSDCLDLFVIGYGGEVYNNSWSETPGGWLRWSRVSPATLSVPVQAVVSAVAQTPDRLDIFLVRQDSAICSSFWDATV